MKNGLLSLLGTICLLNCSAQTSGAKFNLADYEKEILAYNPKQSNTSDKDFKHGVFVLGELRKDVENNPDNFNVADYFNALTALISLGENTETIHIAFEKFRTSEENCEYFLNERVFDSPKYDLLREAIAKQVALCRSESSVSTPIDLKEYASTNQLDYDLVALIDRISKDDERYRKNESMDVSEQTALDKENQALIESLYEEHQTYIGKSLVGEEYEHVMWAVIQHSNVEMMEKYITVVHQAVLENQLSVVPFKMLLDRYYGLKFGYQIFGSQSGFGFEMATDQRRKEIEEMFGIN